MFGKLFYLLTFILISFVFLIPSCTHEPVHLQKYDTICFREDVLPLLQTSCGKSGCHDAATATAGFNATSYESIKKFVMEGDAKGSRLYHAVTAVNSNNMMPPDNPLTYQQRTLLRIWIEQGAKNTICDPIPVDTNGVPVDTVDQPVDTIDEPVDTIIIPPCFEDSVSFSSDLWPILNKNCVGCHNSSRARGGKNLDSYANIVTVASEQQAGVSLLFGVIDHLPGFSKMPQSAGKLDTCSIKIIKTWIDDGMKNN